MKQDKKYFSNIGIRYFIGTLIIYGIQLGAGALVKAVKPEWLMTTTSSLIVSMIPMYAAAMPLMMLLISRMPAADKAESRKMTVGQIVIALFMCYAIMYISNIIGTVITLIIGAVKGSPVQNDLLNIVMNGNISVIAVFTVICAPIYEELIFRKLLVDRAVKYGEGAAVVLSGLMFGLFHGNLSQFAYAATLGMFLAFIYVKTRRIQYTIVLHMAVNFLGSVVSMLVMKASGYMEFAMAAGQLEDPADSMQLVMEYAPGLMVMGVYGLFLLGMVITGVVLLIVMRRKFRLAPGEITIPKGKRFSVMLVNVGMALFCIFWIIKIIVQLFA